MRLTKPQLERILALYDGFAVAGATGNTCEVETVANDGSGGQTIAVTLRDYTIWINPPGLVVDPAPTLRARARQG